MKPSLTLLSRRTFLSTSSFTLLLASSKLVAQTWPAGKPVKLILPNSAGSQVDIVARRLAERLTSALGTNFIVENQPGAGGVIGTQNLIRSPKDGYTLSVVSNNHVIFPHLNKSLKIDAMNDTQPIAMIGAGQMVAVTRASHPAKTLSEMLDMARKQPGKLIFSHSGNGTILHLAGEQMLYSANVQMLVVPYRGVSAMLPDLLSGQVDFAFVGPGSALPLIRDGKLRALAVTGRESMALFPGTPTVAQSGVNGFEMEGWIALIGPANLPAEVVQIMSEAVAKQMADPEVEKILNQSGLATRPMRGEPLRKFFADEYSRYGRLIDQAGIKAE
jgi:tripartite-type tricarboxylate transporter receptor subunit TctC